MSSSHSSFPIHAWQLGTITQDSVYNTLGLSRMTHVQLFVRSVMQTPWCLGVMGFLLVFVPILGMWAIHKYGWEHWEPFSRESHTKTSK